MRVKLLAVSDEVVPWIHSAQLVERCADVDIVLGCGDLPSDYLEYITTMLGKPCFYVRGNHDQAHDHRPEGCINLDLRAQRWGRLQLAGLEGSPRYKPGAPFQYSQNDQWLHGHQHRSYSPMQSRETRLGETLIVNVHPYRVLELLL
jgi:predicted phosphodiesterase